MEGVKYFSRMQAAKQLQAESVAEVIEFFVSHRHHCQHNVLCEAAKVLMSLPGSHTISHEWTQRILLAALHAGCMPSVKAVMRRWPRLNGWFKSLGTDHLVRALDASFSHSRCAPDELFKVVVSHPNAKNLTAAELEPVLNAVCSDRPLGMRDCGNDGCGPPTATAAQVHRLRQQLNSHQQAAVHMLCNFDGCVTCVNLWHVCTEDCATCLQQ